MEHEGEPIILLVDDNPVNVEFLLECLATSGFKLLIASGGEQAIRQIARATTKPDLILLDVMMPDMDGFETCRRLKQQEDTREIPVIFMTALTETAVKLKAFQAGGVDYITKPFQVEEVVARVTTHLTLRNLQKQLQEHNLQLRQEISRRTRVEQELKQHRDHLEELVNERTLKLSQALTEVKQFNEHLTKEIAERKQAEQALQRSERQYRFLAEHVADGIGILHNGRFVFVNNALSSMFDAAMDQLLGSSLLEMVHDDQKPVIRQLYNQFETDGANLQEHVLQCMITGKEREFWIEGRQSAIAWEEKPAILMVVQDITDRKRQELEHEREEELLRQENRQLRAAMGERYRFGDLIGKSPAMQKVYAQILKAAASDANVVISGESGTGKELVAWTIYQMSERRKKPFVPVNCGAIAESLVERELFGHRKGAFTGAHSNQIGFFGAAEGGTLFLDEVGELSTTMQVKFLRAVAGGGYTPVGDHTVRKANVRIIAATNKHLEELVKQGMMREDFYYRINVIPIVLPPLRDRKEDIPLLVEYLLQQAVQGEPQPELSAKISQALYDYDWPGNVRELQNVLQRYLTTGQVDFITLRENGSGSRGTSKHPGRPEKILRFRDAVGAFEKQIILDALNDNRWHKTKTAAMLGLSRKSLFRKMKQYGLS